MGVSIKFNIQLVSQSAGSNTSNIAVKLICSWDNGSYNHKKPSGTVVINNTPYPFTANINPNNTTSGSNTIFTKNLTIRHNSNGTATVNCSANFNTGLNAGTIRATENKTIPVIARYPTLLSAQNFSDTANPTITYSNPAGDSVDTLIAYIEFGDSYSIEPRELSKTGTSFTFTLTYEERRQIWKSVTSGRTQTATFCLQSSINGIVRVVKLEKTVTLVNHLPIVSLKVEDSNPKTIALTGDKNILVKYFSNAKITGSASGQKEATIKSVKVVCGAKSISSASGTINAVESNRFTLTAVDSRGNESNDIETRTMVNYLKLTCNLEAEAPTTDGKMNFYVGGNYFNDTFGAVANTLTIQYRYKVNDGVYGNWVEVPYTLTDNTYNVNATLTGLDYLSVYTFQARAIDKLATVNSAEKVVNTVPIFDWSEDDFNFNVNVSFPNKNIKEANIGIRSTNSAGTSVSCLVPCTDEDVLMLGWGNYNAGIGRTNIYGNDINFFTTDGTGNINANGNLKVNGREYAVNKVLWDGAYYMTAGHTAPLSENVSEQPNGIVLVFSYYSSGAKDYYFQSFFIPKALVAAQGGSGHTIILAGTNFNPIGTKYLYISDDVISGNENNNATGTANGITYNNAAFVLRYVIGV